MATKYYMLVAPDGTRIRGTLDMIPGTAVISYATLKPDGSFDYEYAGDTEVDWDGQTTVVRKGQEIFVDDNGLQWPANQLKCVEEDSVNV